MVGEKTLRVRVRFFGFAAELAGCRESELEVATATVAGVVAAARREFPALKPLLDGSMRFAVGTDYAKPDARVGTEDVVSFLPPVGGG